MFSVGEYVIYGNHGVCKIEKMGGVSLPLVDGKKSIIRYARFTRMNQLSMHR